MSEGLAWAAATALLGLLALGAAAVVRRIRTAFTIASLPEAEERMELLALVRGLRRDGASLESCIAALRERGVKGGVAKTIVLDVEREQPADVEHTQEARWRGHRFRFPGNWRLEPIVPEAGMEAGISIEGIGSALLMLVALGDGQTELEEAVHAQERLVRDPQRSPLRAWGSLAGEGSTLRGVHAKMRLPIELTTFRTAGAAEPFLVLELFAMEERDLVQPGFALVRESFTPAG